MNKNVCSVNKESILDIEAEIVTVPQPVESCTQKDVELDIRQLWVVSSAAPQLPLQIEDASRPEKSDVSCHLSIQGSEYAVHETCFRTQRVCRYG